MTSMNNSSSTQIALNLWSNLNKVRGVFSINELEDVIISLIFLRYIKEESLKGDLYKFEDSITIFDGNDSPIKQNSLFANKRFDQIEIDHVYPATFNGDYLTKIFNKVELDNPVLEGVFSSFDFFSFSGKMEEGIVLNSIITFIDTIDFQEINFGEFFDELLYAFAKSKRATGGENVIPFEISRLICRLVELPENAKVYNPFAGLASFGVFLQKKNNYYGQELSRTTWAHAVLRLLANKKIDFTKFVNDDSILNWPNEKEKFDLIISSPPFGIDLNKSPKYNGLTSDSKNFEQFFIEKGISSLKNGGKLIAVVSNGFLFRGATEKKLREHLIKEDLIEMIIALPGGLFANTSIPVSVIVINKEKTSKEKVRFIDASTFVSGENRREKKLNDILLNSILNSSIEQEFTRLIPNKDIIAFEYNLSVPRYFLNNDEGIVLGQLITKIKVERINDFVDEKGKLVRSRDLKNDKINFSLDTDNIEDIKLSRHIYKLNESSILFSLRTNPILPTYFKFKGFPIFLYKGIVAYKVDETKVDLEFLIHEMHSKYVTEQINSYYLSTGGLLLYMSESDLLKIKIDVPPIDEQRRRVQLVKESVINTTSRENELLDKIKTLEHQIKMPNSYLRHSISGPLTNIKYFFSELKELIEKAAENKEILSLDKKYYNGEETLLELMEIIHHGVEYVSHENYISGKEDIEISKAKIDSIKILEEVDKFVKTTRRENLEIKNETENLIFGETELKIEVSGEKSLFLKLLHNLLDNAEKHAFKSSINNKEIFSVELLLSDNKTSIVLKVSNTGYPFKIGYNKSKFVIRGNKTGENSGDGFGGYMINEICSKMNGTFDFESNLNDDVSMYTTIFEFKFPIINLGQ